MKGDDFLKELHTDELSMNSGKLFREQMVENFKAIEQVINDIEGRLETLEKKNKQDSDFDKHLYD